MSTIVARIRSTASGNHAGALQAYPCGERFPLIPPSRSRLRPGCSNRRQMINTVMRAWEIFESEGLDRHRVTPRRPIISLRHIHKLKKMRAARRAEREQRPALWSLMYGQDDAAERERDQRDAKLDQREGEVRMKELQVSIEKAINRAEVDAKAKQRLQQMAMAELRRRRKQPPPA